jgi:hypothetical protein
MKTSNKILLGIFLAVLLLTTTIHLMVYAKYKRGEYAAFQRDKILKVASVNIPVTRFVSVKNLGNCVLVNSATSRFETDQNKVKNISYRVVNDTLIIHGDTTLSAELLDRGLRNFQMIKVYLPATVQVNATSCNLFINGAVDSVHAPSYSIHMSKKCELNIRDEHGLTSYFDRLFINSEGSGISLDNKVIVTDLNLTLALSSRVDYSKSTIRKMTLDMDSSSFITLSGKNFKALQ